MTDPLADLIGLTRPHAVLWKRIEGAGRWAIGFPAHSEIVFGTVVRGRCLLLEGGSALELAQGDFLLLAGSGPFVFASEPDAAPVDGERLLAEAPGRQVVLGSGDGEPVTLVGGDFLVDPANAGMLTKLMPGRVHLRDGDPGTRRIAQLLGLIGDESTSDRPGGAYILPRLAEVLLVEAVRSSGSSGTPPEGLLRGLADPPIAAALRALHADVRRPWTVAQLAATARLSRSVFAERFAERVGVTPIEYLLAWRMALAREALVRGDRTIDGIAHELGYGSASAFSNAFRRVTGVSPGRYAKTRGA
ncbi:MULTISPECIES: AraC family transcriptional regulator [Amycolatopsis]|uniref:AraC-type DNA-binding protein n=2 Tax=Amycolatopsis TaxID=1813 RepID=A0A1I3X1R7_9PSEU|nr:AraC family transcriptional regulator [Amycolatopsis sacchari]SFK13594.1 AraC-type DNA-binding protein [Amycolatopsis sacchari]